MKACEKEKESRKSFDQDFKTFDLGHLLETTHSTQLCLKEQSIPQFLKHRSATDCWDSGSAVYGIVTRFIIIIFFKVCLQF